MSHPQVFIMASSNSGRISSSISLLVVAYEATMDEMFQSADIRIKILSRACLLTFFGAETGMEPGQKIGQVYTLALNHFSPFLTFFSPTAF